MGVNIHEPESGERVCAGISSLFIDRLSAYLLPLVKHLNDWGYVETSKPGWVNGMTMGNPILCRQLALLYLEMQIVRS